MGDCKSFRSYQMLGSISDGVFFIRWGNDNNADDAMDDCKSLRRCQMLGVSADGVFFIRWGNDNNADDALWAIVNRSEIIRC